MGDLFSTNIDAENGAATFAKPVLAVVFISIRCYFCHTFFVSRKAYSLLIHSHHHSSYNKFG
jgi:sterol desaturase/sphingolipid hydroxylase (fatty acid hydroxylase superfamily)